MIIIAKAKNSLKNKTELILKIKEAMKDDAIFKDICKDHGFEYSIIDGISMEFDDIDVSAKTVNSKIILNLSLMDSDFEVIMRYAIHEFVHSLQHMGDFSKNDSKADDYLDDENEIEAFKRQVQYQAKEEGFDKAEEYVEDLVEYHEVPHSEKEDKKQELLEKVK